MGEAAGKTKAVEVMQLSCPCLAAHTGGSDCCQSALVQRAEPAPSRAAVKAHGSKPPPLAHARTHARMQAEVLEVLRKNKKVGLGCAAHACTHACMLASSLPACEGAAGGPPSHSPRTLRRGSRMRPCRRSCRTRVPGTARLPSTSCWAASGCSCSVAPTRRCTTRRSRRRR